MGNCLDKKHCQKYIYIYNIENFSFLSLWVILLEVGEKPFALFIIMQVLINYKFISLKYP